MQSINDYYLAIDLGASSGRHILGYLDRGKLVLKEIHRFENAAIQSDTHLLWDTDRIFSEILTGIKKCKAMGQIPKSLGLDTWGVDYVLIDKALKRVGPTYAYRNRWTDGRVEQLDAIVPPEELYARTGIQRITINTIYHLMAQTETFPEELYKARRLLMLPDYFHFLLSGEPLNEYTIASTTGLMDAHAKRWDHDLISAIGVNPALFETPVMPGTKVGALQKEIADAVGFSANVVLPGSHDTASAVVALPSLSGDPVFISSGTWSLLGCESLVPFTDESARIANLSNEGGYDGRYRFLKNIMGLWMIQSVRKELANGMSYADICDMAAVSGMTTLIDTDDDRFLAPESMTKAIDEVVREQGKRIPNGIGEYASIIYRSLAKNYEKTLREFEFVTGRTFTDIHVMGGGSNADFLNKLTAEETGLPVHAGPTEATAIGNILCQMIADGVFKDLFEARRCVADSFDIVTNRR